MRQAYTIWTRVSGAMHKRVAAFNWSIPTSAEGRLQEARAAYPSSNLAMQQLDFAIDGLPETLPSVSEIGTAISGSGV